VSPPLPAAALIPAMPVDLAPALVAGPLAPANTPWEEDPAFPRGCVSPAVLSGAQATNAKQPAQIHATLELFGLFTALSVQ
jgi:hypothetical protein